MAMLFPIFGTVGEGLKAAGGFVAARPGMFAGVIGGYGIAAAFGASGILHLPLPFWLSGLLMTWLIALLLMLGLAPIWTALYRFAVLGDRDRRYLQWDVRTRRVALMLAVLAFISLLGAVPFALGLDIIPRVGLQRFAVLGAVSFAALVKAGSFWLLGRLAISGPMAATGSKPEAMDTSFAYTRWAAVPVLATMLLVYLPNLVISGGFISSFRLLELRAGSGAALALDIISTSVATLVSALTDFVWVAVSGKMALRLVKAQRVRAAEEAKRAREEKDGRRRDDD
ncbi:MAG: hypothetical protein NT133_20135 [Alphaproteobacteria bacterium]|nr:hypothetical protein [Alphaproteobacteria bacterium]